MIHAVLPETFHEYITPIQSIHTACVVLQSDIFNPDRRTWEKSVQQKSHKLSLFLFYSSFEDEHVFIFGQLTLIVLTVEPDSI